MVGCGGEVAELVHVSVSHATENKMLTERNKRNKNNGGQETGHRRQTNLKIGSMWLFWYQELYL